MKGMEIINQWSAVWAEFMVMRTLDTSLIFLFAGLVWLFARKKLSAQFGYILFLMVLLKMITPIQLSIPGLMTYWFPSSTVQENGSGFDLFGGLFGLGGTGEGTETLNDNANPESAGATIIQEAISINFPTLFLLIWIIGVAVFLFHQSWVEWKTRFIMRNTIALDLKLLPLDTRELQTIARIKRKVKWVTGYWVKSSVTYGYFHPMVAVPSDIAHH